MLNKEQAKKFVSITTHNQLTKLLHLLDGVKTIRDKAATKEKIKNVLEKIYTYKEIYELHDDHIIELAETIAGIYPELDDLEDYTYFILEYLDTQIAKYEKTCKGYVQELMWKEREKDRDPDGYLDLKYKAWTYTSGYYKQQNQMYRLLRESLRDILRYKESGVICRKRKKTT